MPYKPAFKESALKVAIEDRDLWNMIEAVQNAEIRHFGARYSAGPNELKAKKILKSKVFRMAGQMPPFPEEERRALAKRYGGWNICREAVTDGVGSGQAVLCT